MVSVAGPNPSSSEDGSGDSARLGSYDSGILSWRRLLRELLLRDTIEARWCAGPNGASKDLAGFPDGAVMFLWDLIRLFDVCRDGSGGRAPLGGGEGRPKGRFLRSTFGSIWRTLREARFPRGLLGVIWPRTGESATGSPSGLLDSARSCILGMRTLEARFRGPGCSGDVEWGRSIEAGDWLLPSSPMESASPTKLDEVADRVS